MKAVILAAGAARRFRPLSEIVPKPLLLLGRKPLIHHALDEVERAGFDGAVIVLSPRTHLIRHYFEVAGEPSEIANRLHLNFVEQPHPDGSGDATLCAWDAIGDDACGVILPDDVVTTEGHWEAMFAAHRENGAATLCVRHVAVEEAHRFGIATTEPQGEVMRVTGLIEKPASGTEASNLALFGRYVVTAAVATALRVVPRGAVGEFQLTDGFAAVLGQAPGVVAVEFRGTVFDCGTPEEYARSVASYPTSNSQLDSGAS